VATTYMHVLRGLNRNVRLYLLVHVFYGFASFGVFAVVYNLYLLRLGYGPETIGAMNSGTALAYSLSALVAGTLGKKWGAHRVMWLGILVQAAGYLGLPLAESFPSSFRTAWLVGSGGLASFGSSALLVNGDILLYAEAGEKGTGHALSILLAIWGLTGFAGSLVAGELPTVLVQLLHLGSASPAPYRYVLVLAGAVLTPGLVLVLLMKPGSPEQPGDLATTSGRAPYGPILLIAAIQLLVGAGYGSVTSFFNVYLAQSLHLATSGLGALMAVAQLLPVVVALIAPVILSRWGNRRVYVWSTLATAACLLPLALVRHWAAAGAGYTGIMALMRLYAPAFLLHRLELVKPDWRPVMNGAANMAFGLSLSGTALAGGYTIATWGYPPFFLVAAALTAAGAALFGICFRSRRALTR